MKLKFFSIFFIFILIFLAGCSSNNKITGNSVAEQATIYKSSTCGCCSLYSNYMKSKSDLNVADINSPNIYGIKKKYGVPQQMESCHTSVVGDYFVEGHIPLEAIKKLMTERPDISGIAMPGMPPGAPGMPGAKLEPFIIYAVNKDGSYKEFMRM